jgi:RND family efflux transporter MFP subunit
MNIPQPKQRFISRLGIPLVILIITAAILMYASWESIKGAKEVETITVVMRSVETDTPHDSTEQESSIVQAPGWVEAEPYSVYVGALTEGIVDSVLVLEGDTVTKGQPVATLISEDNELALKTAIANEQLWEGKVRAAQTKMEELADEYTRKKPLVESGSLAEGPIERLRLRLLTEEANVAIARASLHDATVAKETAQLAFDRCTIVSPMDGIVIERLVSPGSVIRFGSDVHSSHVAHMYDPTKLQVRADVPLADASQVDVGHPAQIIVDVLPNNAFDGEVLRFVHRADQQKNTIEAKVKILNPSPLLKPDMLARVKILQPKRDASGEGMWTEQHVFVPKDLINDFETPTVWIVQNANKGFGQAKKRTITLGDKEFDGWVEVLSGLSTGDRIITNVTNLVDGDSVQIIGDQQ